mmetsp:Transcript_20585/g.45821  ORF Transcript_20585/g.45821 Transcript_20585/m.45821 type:complete len:291 (-) Transcript_20585:214-1086(-)
MNPLGVFDGARHHVKVLDRLWLCQDRIVRELAPPAAPQIVILLFPVKVPLQDLHVHPVDLLGRFLEFRPVGHRSGVLVAIHPTFVFVLNGRDVHGAVGGKHQARGRFQVFVAGADERIQHALSQQEITHPLADENVHHALRVFRIVGFQAVFLDGKLDFLDGALNHGDDVFDAVRLHDLSRVLGHVGVFDGVDLSGTGLGRPDGQNPRSGTDVHDHLVLEDVRVAQNRRMVGRHPVVVGQHLLLVIELGVRAKVVGKVGGLGLLVPVERGDFSVARGVGKFGSTCCTRSD